MRRYIRSTTPGATFFFTVVLEDRGARYLVDHVTDLRASFAEVKEARPFRTDAVVVLPEHIHAIWTLPEGDADFGHRWMLIQKAFTQRLGARDALPSKASNLRGTKGERTVWQRRFWEHRIRDEEDFARHVDYIHFNPVKHGWVLRARDWPYSSLHRYVRMGALPTDWGINAAIQGTFGE